MHFKNKSSFFCFHFQLGVLGVALTMRRPVDLVLPLGRQTVQEPPGAGRKHQHVHLLGHVEGGRPTHHHGHHRSDEPSDRRVPHVRHRVQGENIRVTARNQNSYFIYTSTRFGDTYTQKQKNFALKGKRGKGTKEAYSKKNM
jgi:hypothetical protein